MWHRKIRMLKRKNRMLKRKIRMYKRPNRIYKRVNRVPGIVSRNHKRIFVTYHKTGHHLSQRIARAFSKECNLTFYDLSRSSEIPDDGDVFVYESNMVANQSGEYKFASYGGELKIEGLNFKGIHMIRHPYEIIASAYRWHQKISKPWVDKEWKGTGKSYKEHLQSEDGIAFEMKNKSKSIIMNIYNFPFSDERFLTIKLEEFEKDFESTIIRIAQHLEIPEKIMLKTSAPYNLKAQTNLPSYVTRKKIGELSHIDLFKPHHYDLFDEIFPPDVFERFGYEK